MSEPVGQVAGRLSVVVESSLAGFRRNLKKKIETAAKGVEVEVGVEIDAKALRKQLQAKADAAAGGIEVTIGVDVDAKTLRGKVETAVEAAASKVRVSVDADAGRLVGDVAAAAVAAEKATPAIRVPLRVRARTFVAEVLAKRAEAQAAARAAGGVNIPVNVGGGKGGIGGLRLRTLFRGGVIFSLLSLIQPAVGAIAQVVAGLTAMVGAAAPAAGTLAAIPISIAAIVQGAMAGKIALQGVGDAVKLLSEEQAALARGEELTTAQQEELNQALKELSPSARTAAKEVVGLRGAWVKMRKGVQEGFFSHVAGEIRPLAEELLPLLEKRLTQTASGLGKYVARGMEFLSTERAQGDLGKVMKNNNLIFRDFLYMVGEFSQGSIDFLVASRRFGRGAGETMRDVGDWFSGKMASGRKSGGIADFLDLAAKKATQLWRITRNIGGGIAGIFGAGTDSGNRLLHMFDRFTANWHAWVDSAEGQDYLSTWFRRSRKGFVEMSRLVNDTFKGIAKWAADPKIAGMLEQIRTELGPALGKFLKDLGDDAGAGVIDFLTQLTRALGHLEPAIETVSLLTDAITGLLRALNDLADVNPGTTEVVAKVLGGLLLFSSAKRILKVGTWLTGIGKGAKGLPAAGAGAGKAAGGFARLSAVLSRLGKVPLLKKAGIAGLLLTAVDMARSGKEAYDFGGKQAEAITEGFRNGVGSRTARDAISEAIDTLLGSNSNPFVGQQTGLTGMLGGNEDLTDFAKKVGIDTDRLKEEIARLGTTGDYYKSVLQKLESYGSLWKNPAYGIPGVDTDQEDAKSLAEKLRSVAEDAMAAITTGLEGNSRAKASALTMADMLLGPVVEGSKQAKAKLREVTAELRAEVERAAKIAADPAGYLERQERRADRRAVRDMLKFQPPPSPASDPKNPFVANADAGGAGKAADKAVRSQNRIAQAAERTRRVIRGSLPYLRRTGDEYAAMGKKADKSSRQTTRGAKQIEAAGRKAARAAKAAAAEQAKAFASIPKKAQKSATDTTKAVARMGKEVSARTKALTKDVSKGMDGVVKAVRSTQGPARTASKGVGEGIKQPLSGLRGPLSSAGSNAMAGFTAGIRAEGANAVAAAASIAAQVAAATRKQLDIHSPSKVMQKLGHWVSAGFAKGIKGGLKAVRRVQDALWDRLTSKVGKERVAALKKQFAAEFRVLENQARLRDRLADRIDRVSNRVNSLKTARANMRSTLKSGAREFGSIGAISQDNGGVGDPGFLLAELKRRAKDSKRFRRAINKLRKRGLGKNAIQQIIDLGMEDGLPLAQQLLSGAPEELKKMNRLQAIISKQAKKLGQETAKGFFNSGIKAGQGMLRELRSRQKELNKIAARMGQALVNQIRRALGLRVPKKDAKQAQGGHGGAAAGAAAGRSVAGLREAARQSRRKSSPARRPATPRSGRLTDVSHATASAMASAPLVGELTITGVKDAAAARDALDETYFMLRRIRLGGLHADRTA